MRIKSINLEGLKKIGLPQNFGKKYYEDNIDELIFVDTVATLNMDVINCKIYFRSVKRDFVPLTIGGV